LSSSSGHEFLAPVAIERIGLEELPVFVLEEDVLRMVAPSRDVIPIP
jgi:hypothetical protein